MVGFFFAQHVRTPEYAYMWSRSIRYFVTQSSGSLSANVYNVVYLRTAHLHSNQERSYRHSQIRTRQATQAGAPTRVFRRVVSRLENMLTAVQDMLEERHMRVDKRVSVAGAVVEGFM